MKVSSIAVSVGLRVPDPECLYDYPLSHGHGENTENIIPIL